MDIRTAMYKAADSIEMNPELFDFEHVLLPDSGCGTPACALGWISFHLGYDKPWYFDKYEKAFFELLGTNIRCSIDPEDIFYDRMAVFSDDWRHSAPECAKALRLYADKYHPESEIKQGIPQWALDIFKPEKIAA